MFSNSDGLMRTEPDAARMRTRTSTDEIAEPAWIRHNPEGLTRIYTDTAYVHSTGRN